MLQYRPSPEHDFLLEAWYHTLRESGDLDRVMVKAAHPLSIFLQQFAPPKELVFVTDETGICFAFWLEPVMGGAFAGLWVAPHKRYSPSTLKRFRACLEGSLAVYPLILGITKQASLLAAHKHLGYTIHGPMPRLWDGQDAWLVMLTLEGYTNGRTRTFWHRRQRQGRERQFASLPNEHPAPGDGPTAL